MNLVEHIITCPNMSCNWFFNFQFVFLNCLFVRLCRYVYSIICILIAYFMLWVAWVSFTRNLLHTSCSWTIKLFRSVLSSHKNRQEQFSRKWCFLDGGEILAIIDDRCPSIFISNKKLSFSPRPLCLCEGKMATLMRLTKGSTKGLFACECHCDKAVAAASLKFVTHDWLPTDWCTCFIKI